MKKIFQLVCVAAFAAGFVACGNGAANTNATEGETTDVEVSVLDTTNVEAAADTVKIEVGE